MKVLSLLQPWASLVVLGHKKIETRSWNTKHRGELLIHASAKWSGNLNDIACSQPMYNVLAKHGFIGGRTGNKCGLPLGAIIGKVNVLNTASTDYLKSTNGYLALNYDNPDPLSFEKKLIKQYYITSEELAFGDYSTGRYGWLLSDPVAFSTPIGAKGQLNVWNLPAELEPIINHQIEIS